jgi:hypothetical protein
MSRMRVLTGLLVFATAGLLLPATGASAAAPLTAAIVCNGATGAITTSVSGALLAPGPPTRVKVQFQRKSGVRVTATTFEPLMALVKPVTVTALTTSSGEIAANGYTGTFTPATAVFYRETVVATFTNAITGAFYTTREATCDYDQRTTVALTCDPAAGTVTAVVTGRNGQAGTATNGGGRPVTVSYRLSQTSQATATGPRFTSHALGDVWDFGHAVTQAADGTWADQGYLHTITSHPYFYSEQLTVGVFDAAGAVVGAGDVTCTLFDGAPA